MKHHGTDTCVECTAPAGHTLICDKCAAEKGYANDNRARVDFVDDVDPAAREEVGHE
ncbi:hypothetical protein [Sphingobium scionense]|uniref:Uncharacterized protein n=1 Tax=Sphingobium scionense TaxID=1404341 RepID=A0A7W6LPS1_9SPHN|nr:hypothetical protein [Sphingobium scionense]MBB4147947.1 hypothetical protein [Sphingobium scionense]